MKKNKIYGFLLVLIFHLCLSNYCYNENHVPVEIIDMLQKFFDSPPIILNEEEKLIAEYWKTEFGSDPTACPFTKFITHGLTANQAHILIEFFKITDVSDIEKLEQLIKK